MYECFKTTSLSADTLPIGTQSTKGCGQTIPDPKGEGKKFLTINMNYFFFSEYYYTDDGVLIPMGDGVNANISHSSL